MCGIAGMYSLGGVLKREWLEPMTNALEHRGPDHMGFYSDNYCNLGSRRLSIIDVRYGNQPIFNEDKSIVTIFNGEIFNFNKLRDDLIKQGHTLITNTDTEVIAHLYEEYKDELVHKLEGQFALAVYDIKRNEFFIARDRMGICPLYYAVQNNVLYFSSEVKSFAQLDWFTGQPDIIGLAQSLKYWSTIAPRTIFKQISAVPIAHCLNITDEKEIKLRRYHSITDYKKDLNVKTSDELSELIRFTMRGAVKKRLISDPSVHVGAYVSGGVDSAIITHLINEIGMNDFTTFSLSFEDAAFDESVFQKDCTKTLNSKHIEVKIPYDKIPEAFPETIRHTEIPFFRTAPVPMYLLSKTVHEHDRKVVLSGEGSDEIFYGYDIFKEVLVRRLWANNPGSKFRSDKLREVFSHDTAYDNPAVFNFLKGFYSKTLDKFNDPLYPLLAQWQNGEGLFSFFTSDCKAELEKTDLNGELLKLLPPDFGSLDVLKRCQGLQMELLLGGYLLSSQGDRVLNANSVEGRYPFLDEDVVALAYNIPAELKLYGLQEKYILREAFKGMIPESIRTRKKFPYQSPEAKVFFGKKEYEYVEELTSEASIREYGIFEYKKVKLLVEKFKTIDDPSKFSTRDNLIMTFILGTQMLMKLARNKFNL